MKTSAVRKIRTLMRKASAIPGKDSRKTSGSKNACLTSGHPDALTTIAKSTPTTTSVLMVATAIARPVPGAAEPMMREPLLPVSALPEVRGAGRCQVLPLEALHRAVGPQSVERPVHTPGQRVAPLEHHSEVLAGTALGELAHDRPVVELDRHDVERRRQ